jgi:hypothetical protein
VIAGNTGEHPRDVGEVNRFVGAVRIDERKPSLGDDLFDEVSRGPIDGADHGPDRFGVNEARQPSHTRSPRALGPDRHESKGESSVTARRVGVFDGKLSGEPSVAAVGMIRIGRTEVSDSDVSLSLRFRHISAGSVVGGVVFARFEVNVLCRALSSPEQKGDRHD